MEETAHLPDAPAPESEQQWRLGLTGLKTAFDVSWKVVLVLWAVSQFYFISSETSRKVDADEIKIQNLENNFNRLDRELVEAKGEVKSLHEQMEMERQFYLQTQTRK
jgi:hypothetical protein